MANDIYYYLFMYLSFHCIFFSEESVPNFCSLLLVESFSVNWNKHKHRKLDPDLTGCPGWAEPESETRTCRKNVWALKKLGGWSELGEWGCGSEDSLPTSQFV